MRTAVLLLILVVMATGVGCGTPSFLVTPVANTNRLKEEQLRPGKGWSPAKVAIIEVEGMLMNARSGGLLQPTENKVSLFVQQLEQAAGDRQVRAVVLRINSPGGTVTASDTLYQAVVDFREKTGKPVVAATQEVAASGGYYVALGADRIVAHPTSVVGSIGVIFHTFDFEGTMQKIGMRAQAIKSGPLKDMGSPFHRLTDPERAVMQAMVDEYHARFVERVKAHRAITDEPTLELATDGRVFSGEQAQAIGLVDVTGTLEDAIDLAQQLAEIEEAAVVMYRRPYGYGGSIYASSPIQQPQGNVLTIELPGTRSLLPSGFYYLWPSW